MKLTGFEARRSGIWIPIFDKNSYEKKSLYDEKV